MVEGSPQVFISYHRAELGVAGRLRAHLEVVTGFTVDLVGPLAAITAAATAWTQLGRNDELAKSYGLAAHEQMVLHSRLELAETEEAFRQGVEETESAISREHTMWMAKRG